MDYGEKGRGGAPEDVVYLDGWYFLPVLVMSLFQLINWKAHITRKPFCLYPFYLKNIVSLVRFIEDHFSLSNLQKKGQNIRVKMPF